MVNLRLLAIVVFSVSSLASAQDVLLSGHVQRVILLPSGADDCPPPCSLSAPRQDGSQTVCISNGGGCQIMDVRVDRVYRGAASGETRQFRSRIGEWGPSFPVTDEKIVVSEMAGVVSWSPATERDGVILVDPKRLPGIGGMPEKGSEAVALEEALARSNAAR